MWKLYVFDCRYIVICRRQAISDAVFRPQRTEIPEQAVSEVSDGNDCNIIHLLAFQNSRLCSEYWQTSKPKWRTKFRDEV